MTVLEVTVDSGLCVGARGCVHQAPTAFVLGDDGVAVVRDITAVFEPALLEAAQSCPNDAIRVARDGVQLWP